MLESAEIGHRVAKDVYAREEPRLRESLLLAQFELSRTRRGPVLVIVSGVDGAGRGETANALTAWMDPRHIQVVAFGARTPEEAVHPGPWRYWQALPPSGRLGIFMHAWYNDSMRARMQGRIDDDRLETHLEAIREHEQMLSDEGLVLLKFWIHLSKAAQKKRLKAIERDPRLSWRATRDDWKAYHAYRKSYPLWETLLRETSTTAAPWYVVEGTDERYRNLTVGRILLDAMRATAKPSAAARANAVRHPVTPIAPSAIDNVKLIRDLDLSKKLSARAYPAHLEKWQGALARLSRHKRFAERSLVVAFEGVDAAGKGGAIRRVTGALDARQYVTVPIAAPTDEELAHPYLWRFWRKIPRRGGITLFDRSWYGRVLVERVEHLSAPGEWMRAYAEINQFEEQLTQGGVIVVKFWLQLSKAEQLRRFRAREHTPFKRFKITRDDWRNRKRWNDYEIAVCDMVDRTSTMLAPWTLVEAEDKRYARIKVLKTIVHRIEAALER
jgi:polyphosphate:AMP phosphotransferase